MAIVHDVTFRQLVRARDFVQDAYERGVTVSDMARVAGFSPYHFLRTFQRAFGETPHAYVTRVRLERAKRLLLRGASVTEVCMEVGFQSLGSFSSLFAREVGLSPAKFRKLVQVPGHPEKVFVPHCFASFFLR